VLLDWGLATQGHPVVDYAWHLMHSAWRIDATHDQLWEDFRAARGERDDPLAVELGMIAGLVMYGWILGHSAVIHPDPAERTWARTELEWWVPRASRAGGLVAPLTPPRIGVELPRVMIPRAVGVLGVRVAHDGQHVGQTERSRRSDPTHPATSCKPFPMSRTPLAGRSLPTARPPGHASHPGWRIGPPNGPGPLDRLVSCQVPSSST
jgi:hypothetical protein